MRRLIDPNALFLLSPGEVVSTFGPGNVEHFGVASESHAFGGPVTFISASKFRRAVVEDLPFQFAPRSPIYTHGVWSSQPWPLTVAKARSKIGVPYDLYNRNCEHFVRYRHGLPEESPQLRGAVGAFLVGGVIALAFAA